MFNVGNELHLGIAYNVSSTYISGVLFQGSMNTWYQFLVKKHLICLMQGSAYTMVCRPNPATIFVNKVLLTQSPPLV